jgi:hypothetical protein
MGAKVTKSEVPNAAPVAEEVSDFTWRFLGLEIGRKTEILALAAFLMSISGAMWQIQSYLSGPVVRLFPSDQIVVTNANKLGRAYEGEQPIVRFIAILPYVNQGASGYNAIIRRESIQVLIGDRTYEHRWYAFVTSDVKDGALDVKKESDARPFALPAGSSVSHETLFAPWEVDCEPNQKGCNPARNFLTWDAFLADVVTLKRMEVVTTAEIYSHSSVRSRCTILFRNWELDILRKEQWLSASCREEPL